MSDDGLPPAVACYWHGAHYEGETCGGAATATDFGVTGTVRDLLQRQRDAVDRYLRDVLATRGIDPDDRSDGWEHRARAALAHLEAVDTFDLSDDYRATITTEIRQRKP